MTESKPFAAGDDVDSQCLKCKALTNHTIIALIEEKIAKVQCNVCRASHKYRPAVAAKPPRVRAPAKPKRPAPRQHSADWDAAQALKYSMTAAFRQNDLIDHPTFGLGLVVGTIQPNKIEAQFDGGRKILCCGSVS